MKKIIAVLCTCLALFGCSEKTVEKTDTSVKITVSFWEPGMGKELSAGMQQVIDDYHELHPEVEVEMLIYPVTEYNEHMRKLYSVNNLPDIISNHSSQLLLMARQGLLADLTEELSMPSAYEPQAAWEKVFDKQFLGLVNSMYETKRYNLPFFNNETAVFYNREIYQELGLEIPKTWEELLSNFDVIQKSGKTAMAIMADKGDIKLWLDWELGNEIGLEKMLENPDININGDGRITDYEISHAILSGAINYETDSYIHEWYEEYTKRIETLFRYSAVYEGMGESAVKAAFFDGEFVHLNTGTWDAVSILGDERFGVFRFPTSSSCSTAQSFAVTTSAEKTPEQRKTAIDFLQFFTSKKEYQKFIDITMQLPVIKGVTVSEQMRCFENDGMSSSTALTYVSSDSVDAQLAGSRLQLNQSFFHMKEEQAKKRAADYFASYEQERTADYSEAKFTRKGVSEYE